MSVSSFSTGDVLFVEIAFSGSVGSKRRPVIVLSTSDYNRSGSKVIVAGVTSNLAPPPRFGDVILQDWSQAGLLKPSAVRGLVTTVDRTEVVRTLGALTERDFAALLQGVKLMLGLAEEAA
jgi:mRNA interferase MazF